MIGYIKGMLAEVETDTIIVENNGIGYQINVPASATEQLPPVGEELKVYTYMYVREDILGLYGFLTRDDMQIFKLLITVNGIGPKGALGILSTVSADRLRLAVISGDEKAIAKAPGVGRKTAQKLIIELKDKLKLEDLYSGEDFGETAVQADTSARKEAILALTSLGYSDSEAVKAVRKAGISEAMDSETILKLALKQMLTF